MSRQRGPSRALAKASVVEAGLFVGVLAGYLVAIAAALRRVSDTLAKITFGVRAIEKQTEPIGPSVRRLNEALGRLAPTSRPRRSVARSAGD